VPTLVGRRRQSYEKSATLKRTVDDGTQQLSAQHMQDKFADVGALCTTAKATGLAVDRMGDLFAAFESSIASGSASSSGGSWDSVFRHSAVVLPYEE
jgi:hypothetical protein